MALLYVFAGGMHFLKPNVYLRIIPRYLPYPKQLVFWSGVGEVAFGIGLCFSMTKDLSCYGIIAMLTVFLLVHAYMLSDPKAGAGIPKWILALRVPFQFVLMYWAYNYVGS